MNTNAVHYVWRWRKTRFSANCYAFCFIFYFIPKNYHGTGKNPNIYTFLIRLEYFVLMSLSSFHAGFSFKSDVQLKNTRKRSALILWIWLPKWMKLVCSCGFSHFTSLNFVQLHFNQQHSSSSHLDFMCRFLFIFFFHFKNNDLNEKKERINMEK